MRSSCSGAFRMQRCVSNFGAPCDTPQLWQTLWIAFLFHAMEILAWPVYETHILACPDRNNFGAGGAPLVVGPLDLAVRLNFLSVFLINIRHFIAGLLGQLADRKKVDALAAMATYQPSSARAMSAKSSSAFEDLLQAALQRFGSGSCGISQ
jgi:hypothetical protein